MLKYIHYIWYVPLLLFVWIFVLCVMGMAPGLLNPYNSGFLIPIWTNLSAEGIIKCWYC